MLLTIKTKEVKRKKMDKTSNRVMKLDEYDDAVFYRSSCSCGDPRCDVTLELEYNKDTNGIDMVLYKDLIYASWFNVNSDDKFRWIKEKWLRVKAAIKILFTGKIEQEGAFLFKGIDHLVAFITAIQEGKSKIMENKSDGS